MTSAERELLEFKVRGNAVYFFASYCLQLIRDRLGEEGIPAPLELEALLMGFAVDLFCGVRRRSSEGDELSIIFDGSKTSFRVTAVIEEQAVLARSGADFLRSLAHEYRVEPYGTLIADFTADSLVAGLRTRAPGYVSSGR
jgi:hypothetical protein